MSVDFTFRIIGLLVFGLGGLYLGQALVRAGGVSPQDGLVTISVTILVSGLVGFVITPFFTTRPYRALQKRIKQTPATLIQADDLGYGDLSAYGQTRFQTPELDRLAHEGMRFTQYYAGSTVCAPSRAALMTGRHTGHAWIRGNGSLDEGGDTPLRPEDVTVAEVLKTAGYRTAVIGK